jgi:membrane protein insertase Oxa1/YidC/SpoIIIJ
MQVVQVKLSVCVMHISVHDKTEHLRVHIHNMTYDTTMDPMKKHEVNSRQCSVVLIQYSILETILDALKRSVCLSVSRLHLK